MPEKNDRDIDDFTQLPDDLLDAEPLEGASDPLAETEEVPQPGAEEPAEQAAMEETPKSGRKQSVLARLQQTDPFTVMLAISLLAVLIAIYCLYQEYSSYEFDTEAKDAVVQAAPAELLAPYRLA